MVDPTVMNTVLENGEQDRTYTGGTSVILDRVWR